MTKRQLLFATAITIAGCNATGRIAGELDVEQPPDQPKDTAGTPPGDADSGADCAPDLEFFRVSIFEPVLGQDCIACHRMDGAAGRTRMILAPPTQAGYLERNYAAVRAVAVDEVDGVSLLLLKPTLQIPHGGGQRFETGGETYRAFETLVHRFENPGSCTPAEDPGLPREEGVACNAQGPRPGQSPLRPLSSTQLRNSVRDLFVGTDLSGALHYPEHQISNGFSTYIGANIVSQAGAENMLATAEEVARRAVQDLAGLLACPAGDPEAKCVSDWVHRFGKRAFRRPLLSEEHDRLMALYLLPGRTLAERVGMIIEVVLQSPQFLYLDERDGTPASEAPGVTLLSPYAVAAKLSYFLWDTTPDERLLSLADAGGLRTREELRAEAERMVRDPRAREVIGRFHRDWLQIRGLSEAEKDGSVYPEFDPALAASMEKEMDLFVEHVLFDQGGTFEDLMTSRVAFTNPAMDALYGTASGSTGPDDFREVELPAETRSGFLTRAGFLASHAYDGASSPIARGVFVLRNMLCLQLEVPPGLVTSPPEEIEGTTARERLSMHRESELCASCHDRIDPIGLAMEHFDGIGRWRDRYENGRAIDATGTLDRPAGEFDGGLELTEILKDSRLTWDCYATNWYRYAVGRVEETADSCAIDLLTEQFKGTGGRVRDLLVDIAASDTFRYRRTNP